MTHRIERIGCAELHLGDCQEIRYYLIACPLDL